MSPTKRSSILGLDKSQDLSAKKGPEQDTLCGLRLSLRNLVTAGCTKEPDCVKSHRDGPPAYWR